MPWLHHHCASACLISLLLCAITLLQQLNAVSSADALRVLLSCHIDVFMLLSHTP